MPSSPAGWDPQPIWTCRREENKIVNVNRRPIPRSSNPQPNYRNDHKYCIHRKQMLTVFIEILHIGPFRILSKHFWFYEIKSRTHQHVTPYNQYRVCRCLHIRSTSAQHSLWHCIPTDLLACGCHHVRAFTPPHTTGLYWCVTWSSAMLGAQRRRIWAVCLWTWVFWLVYCANGTYTLQDTDTPRTTEVFYTHFSFVFIALWTERCWRSKRNTSPCAEEVSVRLSSWV